MSLDLFANQFDSKLNYLPYNGTVNYYGLAMDRSEADRWFQYLLHDIAWKNDLAVMFGKRIETKRKVAWYAEKPLEYTYSKITKTAIIFTPELLELKSIAEQQTGETYNSCLLNLYHNGSEGMAYHSDGESDLKKNGSIASMSFGAERKFSFKHKLSGERIDLMLHHGSLLVMKDETQTHWQHRLPPTKTVNSPRINLTFRTVVR
ncbi:MAG: alpha-ketoglutarate-dependent dioxygenase AlkB [Salibacteraceae bacterium]|nr:alpha-ketoglutarate-dependent dioxygenase AlkB [Salibacteraceae bacterium]